MLESTLQVVRLAAQVVDLSATLEFSFRPISASRCRRHVSARQGGV